MQRVASFEKVTREQFLRDLAEAFPSLDKNTRETTWDGIRLPRRATAGSAGYDFYAPVPFSLSPGDTLLIPTGIRVKMRNDYALFLFPRSGLGFRFRLVLNNTVGIIDSDYYHAANEGHIMIKVSNDSREGKTIHIDTGEAFAQGIFLTYGITEDDSEDAIRTGGFGSTG